MEPLISVIVPAYNIANYIERCIKSLLSQTYPRIEIIVVDDGSSDRTANLIDALVTTESRIKALHQQNSGVTIARLNGVAQASGEWIGFVDGDDYVEPDMFERLLKNALANHAQISHCGYQMVFPNRVDYYYNTGKFVVQNSREALKELLSGSYEPGLCNKLFHKSVFHRFLLEDLMDTSIKVNEDLLMNFYLFREASLTVFEDFCPYHYIVRKGSAATAKPDAKKLRDPGTVREILLRETTRDAELYSSVLKDYTRYLVKLSVMKTYSNSPEIQELILSSRSTLRNRRSEIYENQRISSKQKLQMMWALLWPESYRLIHQVYAEITGVNHKYDID